MNTIWIEAKAEISDAHFLWQFMFFIKIHIRMHNFLVKILHVVKSYFKSKPKSVTLVIMNQNDVNFERKCPSLINKWPIWSIMDRPISLRKLTKVIILEFTKNFGHLGSFLVFFVQKFQKSEIFVEIMTSGTIMSLVFGQKLWFLNKIDILKNRFFVPKSFEIGKI